VTYTPAANYYGSDSFTFRVNDGFENSDSATISITVNAVNDAPAANSGTLTTTQNTSQSGTLSATDIESNPLTYSIVANGTKGTAVVTNASTGAYTYTPNAGASGFDSFTFKANDSAADSNTATISVTINDVTAPTVTINQAAGQADPTNGSTINFTVIFSESVSNFVTGDVSLSGTAGATTGTVTGSGTTYTVAVTGMTTSGTVIATVGAGVATDAAGNANTTSTSSDNTVTRDIAVPTSSISAPGNGTTITGSSATIAGTASDVGASVAKVEISIDSANWVQATGTTNWTYDWTGIISGAHTIRSRATDTAGNVETPGAGVSVTASILIPSAVTVSGRTLNVGGSAFTVKGVNYSPVPVGESPEAMEPYGDYFTPEYSALWTRDMPLIRTMGANTLRISWWNPLADHKSFLDAAYNSGTDPIYVIAGFHINAGLDIDPASPANVRSQLINDFADMVNQQKNHPAILMWAIGSNLNVPSAYGNSPEELTNLFSLIDAMADAAHAEDSSHPVTAPMSDYYFSDIVAAYNEAVSLDLWSINVYRGGNFGKLFTQFTAATNTLPKPLVITEFGIDAWDDYSGSEDELTQAEYAWWLWKDIAANSSTCVGGIYMEFTDEWWRDSLSADMFCTPGTSSEHNYCGHETYYSPDGYVNDEWRGIMRIADNGGNPDAVEPRIAYDTLRTLYRNLPAVESVSLSADLSSPQVKNTTVTLSATPTGGSGTYAYQFWIYNYDVKQWTLGQDWGTLDSFHWTPGTTGHYMIEVRVKNAGNPGGYEARTGITFNVYPAEAVSLLALSSALPSPQVKNTTITITATPTGGGTDLRYQFQVFNSDTRQWTMGQDWGSAGSFPWYPTVAGHYLIRGYVKSDGSLLSYEAKGDIYININPAEAVSSLALSSDLPSPQVKNTTITITATPTGGADLRYQFQVFNFETRQWSMGQDWGSSGSFPWYPTVAGHYLIRGYVKSNGSLMNYEAKFDLNFDVYPAAPVSSLELSADLPSPQVKDTTITITATPTGGGTDLRYQFQVFNFDTRQWAMGQDWGSSSSFPWHPTVAGRYLIRGYVRSYGSLLGYEAKTDLYFNADPVGP